MSGSELFRWRKRKAPSSKSERKRERLSVLHVEAERSRAAAQHRAERVERNASFIAVAAGVVSAAAVQLRLSGLYDLGSALALLLSLAGLVFSVIALWPRKVLDIDFPGLYDRYIELDRGAGQMEAQLIKAKRDAVEKREHVSRRARRFVIVGLICVLISVLSVAVAMI